MHVGLQRKISNNNNDNKETEKTMVFYSAFMHGTKQQADESKSELRRKGVFEAGSNL